MALPLTPTDPLEGVGLTARLSLLCAPVIDAPPPVAKLLGLLLAVLVPLLVGLVVVLLFRFASTTRRTPLDRKNMPWLGSQLKYRSPFTEPSFLPEPSCSSTPIQLPGAKAVSP